MIPERPVCNMFNDEEDRASGIGMFLVCDNTVSKNADQMLMPQFCYCFHLLWQALRWMLVLQFQTFHQDFWAISEPPFVGLWVNITRELHLGVSWGLCITWIDCDLNLLIYLSLRSLCYQIRWIEVVCCVFHFFQSENMIRWEPQCAEPHCGGHMSCENPIRLSLHRPNMNSKAKSKASSEVLIKIWESYNQVVKYFTRYSVSVHCSHRRKSRAKGLLASLIGLEELWRGDL